MTSIDIIIVNWNSGPQLYNCLTSIIGLDREEFDLNSVAVVDNASTDKSTLKLGNIRLPLNIIYNTVNRGFAAACNQGARISTADYILFLNPDTTLLKNSLNKPIAFMEQYTNSSVGIVGIQLVDDKKRTSRTCCRFPNPKKVFYKFLGLDRLAPELFESYFMGEWDHGQSQEVDHVIGAFYLVRRKLYESLNGFDERFFVYLEDLDFSLRSKQAGWKSYYLADVQAYHKGGGTSEQVKAKRLFYSLRSRILYGYKHFSCCSATGLMLGTLLIEPITRLIFSSLKLSVSQIGETIKGYGMLWRDLPNIFRTARTPYESPVSYKVQHKRCQ